MELALDETSIDLVCHPRSINATVFRRFTCVRVWKCSWILPALSAPGAGGHYRCGDSWDLALSQHLAECNRKIFMIQSGFTSPSLGGGGWSQEVYALLPSEFRTSQCIFCVRLDSTVDKRAPSAARVSNDINNNYLCSYKPIISLVWDLFSSILSCLNEGGYKTR